MGIVFFCQPRVGILKILYIKILYIIRVAFIGQLRFVFIQIFTLGVVIAILLRFLEGRALWGCLSDQYVPQNDSLDDKIKIPATPNGTAGISFVIQLNYKFAIFLFTNSLKSLPFSRFFESSARS